MTTTNDAARLDVDPSRFSTQFAEVNAIKLAYVRAGAGNHCPIVLVHGWPETKRIWWRVIQPLADAGFDVIVPDLRGFGESEAGEFGDTVACAGDVSALMIALGFDHYVVAGGDFGGPIVQEIALRNRTLVDRMILFNSPLPLDPQSRARWKDAQLNTRASRDAADYFIRQGTDPDGLAGELLTTEQRHRYIATFYTSRFWAHPGAFDAEAVAFHSEPFGNADVLRSSFRPYESSFSPAAQSAPSLLGPNPDTETLILFGTSDHVLYPDFDQMAAAVFERHVGPFLLRNCGHFVPWEAPHAFFSATRAFCRDLLNPSNTAM
jgi:pimeloyl-ACP methyl ester carboxylesterase